MIVAGEASGDLHASLLVRSINSLDSQITFSGLGGKKMKESGVDIDFPLADLAVIGFTEVVRNYFQIRKVFYSFLRKVRDLKPEAVILVDYPGFNLRLAKALKKYNTKVIYYISPQVWAWKENRVNTIKKYVDKMLVLFPFEVDFYKQRGFEATLVGHPLLDEIQLKLSRDDLLTGCGLSKDKLTIGILPGSRNNEVNKLLPAMLGAAQILKEKYDQLQFLVLKAPTISRPLLEKFLKNTNLPIEILDDATYDGINASDLCMVASGTATIVTSILQKPIVVVYKTSLFTYFIAKYFIKIPFIGMVNVIAGKKIVPECIQQEATPENIAAELLKIFSNEPRIAEIKSELRRVKSLLGTPGASHRAAAVVLKSL